MPLNPLGPVVQMQILSQRSVGPDGTQDCVFLPVVRDAGLQATLRGGADEVSEPWVLDL